jgi:hypothetical protein
MLMKNSTSPSTVNAIAGFADRAVSTSLKRRRPTCLCAGYIHRRDRNEGGVAATEIIRQQRDTEAGPCGGHLRALAIATEGKSI